MSAQRPINLEPQVPGLTASEWRLLGITKLRTVVPVFHEGKLVRYTLR